MKIVYDKSKPNGTPRKILNTQLAKKYGWKAKTNKSEGFDLTFKDFLKKKILMKNFIVVTGGCGFVGEI